MGIPIQLYKLLQKTPPDGGDFQISGTAEDSTGEGGSRMALPALLNAIKGSAITPSGSGTKTSTAGSPDNAMDLSRLKALRDQIMGVSDEMRSATDPNRINEETDKEVQGMGYSKNVPNAKGFGGKMMQVLRFIAGINPYLAGEKDVNGIRRTPMGDVMKYRKGIDDLEAYQAVFDKEKADKVKDALLSRESLKAKLDALKDSADMEYKDIGIGLQKSALDRSNKALDAQIANYGNQNTNRNARTAGYLANIKSEIDTREGKASGTGGEETTTTTNTYSGDMKAYQERRAYFDKQIADLTNELAGIDKVESPKYYASIEKRLAQANKDRAALVKPSQTGTSRTKKKTGNVIRQFDYDTEEPDGDPDDVDANR